MQEERYTDLSISLSTFLMKHIGFWSAEDIAEERRRKLGIGYTLFIFYFSLYFQARALYFSWGDFTDILYVSANLLTVVLTLFKINMLLLRKSELLDLILYMYEHFWNRKYIEQEKFFLHNCGKTCMFFTVTISCIGVCVFAAFIVTPICASIGKNETERLHPFNMWIPVLLKTPYYEFFFVVQTLAILHIGMCYFCFDNMFSILSMHLAAQFRILRYRMETLCETEIDTNNKKFIPGDHVTESYKKFTSCVRQHQAFINYCMSLEKVYSLITLAQVMVYSVLICLFGYQILLVCVNFIISGSIDKDNFGEIQAHTTAGRRASYVCLLVGTTGILFMFTYSCHGLMEESGKMGDAIYSAMWTQMPMNEYGLKLRKDLIMVILRSKRICCMTAFGFFPVSIETFSKILSTAASYFTLLRNNVE